MDNGAVARAAAHAKQAAVQRPNIDIKIDSHFTSKVYTSGSVIAGHAVVCAPRDIAYDDFDIIFTGVAATRLDFVQQYPSHSHRNFMKLRMPIDQSTLPDSHIFKAGETYTIPFNFVVPHHLTIGACSHTCVSPNVREHHLRLPPTVGYWEGDDQAPEMVQIEYAIKAKATTRTPRGTPPNRVMDGHHNIKVLPALPEDAPLDITFRDERYNLSKAKTIRKNLLSAKSGKLTASSSQPGAVMLSADGRAASQSSVRINLEFAPNVIDAAPPKINSVSAKITSTTFFGSSPADHLPNLGSRTSSQSNPILNYTTTTSLYTLSMEKVAWQQTSVTPRRDSGYSSYVDEEAGETDGSETRPHRSGNSKSKKPECTVRHISTLHVPFTVPTGHRKFFLPSFHSCLISRTYTLQLSLSVGPTNTAVSLAIPLQLGVEAIHDPHQDGDLPSFESAMAQAAEEEVNAFFQPRLMQVPTGTAQTNSLLPGYEALSRHSVPVV